MSSAWKDGEREIARHYGGERNLEQARGDKVEDFVFAMDTPVIGELRGEYKYRARLPQWIRAAFGKAEVVVIHQKHQRRATDYVMMRRELFDRLLAVAATASPQAER